MATQITAFTAIPDKADDSVTVFSGHVTAFLSELATFRASVNTIVGEMNADRTKVVTTNSGLISDDLDTVTAAQFSPLVFTNNFGFIEGQANGFLDVAAGKNISVGMRVNIIPVLNPTAATIRARVLGYQDVAGYFSVYVDRIIGANSGEYTEWMVIPAAPDHELDFFEATSGTSVASGTGSKTFTVEAGKNFVPGMMVILTSHLGGVQFYLHGVVTSYTSSTGVLVVYVEEASSTETGSDWTLYLSSPLRAARSLGVVQTYTSETRVLETAYQNTSAKPIYVLVTFSNPAYPASIRIGTYLSVRESSTSSWLAVAWKIFEPQFFGLDTAAYWSLGAIVPPGHWYKASALHASVTLTACYELK